MLQKRPAPNTNTSCSIARFQRVAPHLRNYSELPVATGETILNVLSIAANQTLKTIARGYQRSCRLPRQMTKLNLAFYAGGIISYKDYAVLVFQPEPHPENDKSAGALTVEKAKPNKRRDLVDVWCQRLHSDLRHGPGRDRQTARIRGIIKQLTGSLEIQF